jgi:ABC-type branched-subunit amino acid transport system substrate-binding protein
MNKLPNQAYPWWALLSLWFLLGVGGLNAQTPGVTDKEISIGSCSALEGPSAFLGRETIIGAESYFRVVNEAGGINGRKLRLYSFDDSHEPAKAEACWEKLMMQKVFAMSFFVGTPTAAKYVPLAESNEIPLVGLFTGAQIAQRLRPRDTHRDSRRASSAVHELVSFAEIEVRGTSKNKTQASGWRIRPGRRRDKRNARAGPIPRA